MGDENDLDVGHRVPQQDQRVQHLFQFGTPVLAPVDGDHDTPQPVGQRHGQDAYYPGAHPALIDVETFDAVQAMLARSVKKVRAKRQPRTASPLKGILFDADGGVMSPVANSNRHGQSYRYYVSSKVQRGRSVGHKDAEAVRRISAGPLETLIRERVERLCPRSSGLPPWIGRAHRCDADPPRDHPDPGSDTRMDARCGWRA